MDKLEFVMNLNLQAIKACIGMIQDETEDWDREIASVQEKIDDNMDQLGIVDDRLEAWYVVQDCLPSTNTSTPEFNLAIRMASAQFSLYEGFSSVLRDADAKYKELKKQLEEKKQKQIEDLKGQLEGLVENQNMLVKIYQLVNNLT